MMQKTSIAVIVIIAITACIVTIMAVMGGAGYAVFNSYERSQLRELNVVLTEQANSALAIPLWNFDQSQIEHAAKSIMQVKSVSAVVVRKAGSREILLVLARDPQWNVVRTDKEISAVSFPGQERTIEYLKESIGTVQVFITDQFMEERLAKIRIAIICVITAVATILILFLYLLLWKIVLKPVKLLEQYAHGAVDASYIRSISFFGELDSLRSSAFAMITQLESRYTELQQYRDHLEVMIEERTSELLLARDAADAANQAKSMFLANMSHEIRTPMNAVLGFAQLLERDPSLSPQARNKVATIMKSGDHLLAIINDILEMSRIEAGRVEMRSESVDLHSLLDDLTVMFRMRAEGKGLLFTLDSSVDLPRCIVADLGKLRQVLVNLLGNAVKFTQKGFITMRAFPVGIDRITIEVEDSGIGITAEEQTNLFRPFERTRSGEQAAGGTGLGLAISREYAHLMGGEITVSSVFGEGSCFRFEFHAPPTTLAPESTTTHRLVTALVPGQGEIRILVVDDQSTNRELLRQILEPLGFIVDEAIDGREAIEKTNCLKPRIVLMDQVMPGMNGSEATRVLRETYTKEALAIIGITASTFEDEKKQFLKAGLNACIAKPFREQELFAALVKHAGVLFDFKADVEVTDAQADQTIPTLEKMPNKWCEEFRQALVRKNITRIRKLGEEAKYVDMALSEWIVERVGRYDLNRLKELFKEEANVI